MEKEFKNQLPYEENNESFGRWFRQAARNKWENFLTGKGTIAVEEYSAMKKFLIENGTQEEICLKLGSLLDTKISEYDAFLEEVKSRRPDIKIPNYKLEIE